jgi:hypothetical protein
MRRELGRKPLNLVLDSEPIVGEFGFRDEFELVSAGSPRRGRRGLQPQRVRQRLASGLGQKRRRHHPEDEEQPDDRRRHPEAAEISDQRTGDQRPEARDEARRIEAERDRGTRMRVGNNSGNPSVANSISWIMVAAGKRRDTPVSAAECLSG